MPRKKSEKPGIDQGIIPALTGKTAEELIPGAVSVGREIKHWASKIYPSVDDPYEPKKYNKKMPRKER